MDNLYGIFVIIYVILWKFSLINWSLFWGFLLGCFSIVFLMGYLLASNWMKFTSFPIRIIEHDYHQMFQRNFFQDFPVLGMAIREFTVD